MGDVKCHTLKCQWESESDPAFSVGTLLILFLTQWEISILNSSFCISLIHCTLVCPRGTVQDFVPASSITQFIMQYFNILQLECVEMDAKYGNRSYLTHLLRYSPDVGFISVPGWEIGSTVSEEWRWSRIKHKPTIRSWYWKKEVLRNYFSYILFVFLWFSYMILMPLCVPTSPMIERP